MTSDSDNPNKIADADPTFYALVGNIASDWSTLEYLVNDCIWASAKLDEQLGACITAQIFSLTSRLEALRLLLRARGASDKIQKDLNQFILDARIPTELRNRAVHDPIGVKDDDGTVQQLQITARGKLIFERRTVKLTQLAADLARINDFVNRFMILREQMKTELASLQYTPTPLFPRISRGIR